VIDFGLNAQALAVAVFIIRQDGVEPSWNDDTKRYDATVRFRPWYNCRETGVVIQMYKGSAYWQEQAVNYAVFEHRNSDEVCCWRWEAAAKDQPTTDDIPNEVAPDKHHHSHTVKYGEIGAMAQWVMGDMEATYNTWEEDS